MASLVLKPKIPNLDSIPNTRNRILINQSGIFLSAPVRVICQVDSIQPPKEEEIIYMIKTLTVLILPIKKCWPKNNPFFPFGSTSLAQSFFL